MSGGIDAYREVLGSGRCRAIAMSVLASGAIPPEEAIEWVCGLEGSQAIVFGASSPGNIRQTKELIERGVGAAPRRSRRQERSGRSCPAMRGQGRCGTA